MRLIREMDEEGRYRIVYSNPNPGALAGLAADEVFSEPERLSPTEYRDWCLSFVTEHDIQILVPGKHAALIGCSSDLFLERGVRVLSAAEPEVLEILNNKARFYDSVQGKLAVPPNWREIASFEEFERAYSELSATEKQVCIKPAVSVYGIGFRWIRTNTSAFELFIGGISYQISLSDLRTMLKQVGTFPTLLLMEYLAGHEYSVDCVCDYGRLVCAVPRRKPLHAGEGQVIEDRFDVIAACREISLQFSLNGFINMQFREGDDGLCVLEVNPRMSGGIGMACLSGINLPYLGLAGFDRGYEGIAIPTLVGGFRVGEVNLPVVLP